MSSPSTSTSPAKRGTPLASTSSSKSKSKSNLVPQSMDDQEEQDDVGEGDEEGSDEDALDEVDVTAKAPGLEIVLSKPKSTKSTSKATASKRRGPTPEQRMIRQETHKFHTTCLIAVGLIRNRWLNDSEIHARLLSQTPSHLIEAFYSFSKLTHPNDRDRTRLFDIALKDLIVWWWSRFKIFDHRGMSRPPGVQLFGEAEEHPGASEDKNKKGKGMAPTSNSTSTREISGIAALTTLDSTLSNLKSGGEWIKSIKSLQKHSMLMAGSRDMSAQLFSALCRALDIPARLVFSLQPIDWKSPPVVSSSAIGGSSGSANQKAKAGAKKKIGKKVAVKAIGGKGKEKAIISSEDESGDEEILMEDEGEEEVGRVKKPIIRLRATKTVKRRTDGSPDPEDLNSPPIFWTEVYSRSHREWITVDPIRKKMRCRGIMEPPRSETTNRMLYVVAFEDDGVVRDVTMRYAKKYTSFTLKARVPSRKGTDWFRKALSPYARTFQLNRDVAEDEELLRFKSNEAMPTSVAAFKDHPNYVLARHLKRDDAVLPDHTKVSDFLGAKGTSTPESVYARSSIVTVKSVEGYMKIGRRIKKDEIPYKWVKARNVTINKKRLEEAAKELEIEGEEDDREGQPLYGEDQTEWYIAEPIVDDKIPKNEFGNIDLYVPSMLPAGGVHIPYKTAAKCAKKLTIPYADAVTGFEFKQRRAYPVLTGIVIPIEYEEIMMAAIEENLRNEEAKESAKLHQRVIKRWARLIKGLRIRERIQAGHAKDSLMRGSRDGGSGSGSGTPIQERSQLGTHSEPSVSKKRKAAEESEEERAQASDSSL